MTLSGLYDSVSGNSGNDTIYAKDGYRDDIYCGAGKKDTVYYDEGIDRFYEGTGTPSPQYTPSSDCEIAPPPIIG